GLLNFYKTHRIGNLEWFEGGKMHRVVSLGGKVGKIVIANEARNSRLLVEIDFPDTALIHLILRRVRSLFDLDSDPLVIANALEFDIEVRGLLRKNPGIRLPSGWDGFEVAVSSILGQFVTVEFGGSLVADLIELLGKDSGLKHGGRSIRLFPTAKQIAESDLRGLKTTSARKETLIAFSKKVMEGELSLEPTQDVDEFLKKTMAIKGIGPWTANYMAMRVLRHTDAFPHTDLILARALDRHPKEVVAQMSPWRAYVATLFWREYSEILKKKKGKRS
ncbi:MAG: AlkA N-terminal domain-containing protein, partial [Bdellovibrionota bacterium]